MAVWMEVGLAFVIATATAAGLYHLQFVPFVHANLTALVAAVFLLLPQVFLALPGGTRAPRRGDLESYGFSTRPRKLGLVVAAVGLLGVLPLFVAGFVAYYRVLCAWAPRLVLGSCERMMHPGFRLAPDFPMLAAAQLIVVALPEELFFRAFLQGRLEDAYPPRWRLLGAKVGGAWIVTAVLFGLGHYFVTFEPQMLTRFFPGLVFGWMYARTRSIMAGTLFHAACNLLMDVLHTSFLL